ncbi:hypothetical protein LEP1GSC132_2390 [Leptospira kirschneri str. 200803703]|nr:hypothetical protein LEP1GSC132_2390 [Leptospira kirschneri str. 200803703]KPZ77396.1 hypothetical protein APS47_12405 [Leptospira kirschneri serovar Mozdok]
MDPSFSKNFLTPEYNTIENTVPDLKREFSILQMWELSQR